VSAGKPVSLDFTVRQHGVTRLTDLTPTVVATLGRTSTRVRASAAEKDGQYSAMLTLPQPGDWSITIHSGFGESSNTLLPLHATGPGETPAALSDVERGRRFFVAKGCVTCHVDMQVGPDLTPKRYEAGWLGSFLKSPSKLPGSTNTNTMPNLNLDANEIAALTAYVNAERRTPVR
jgi:mono/diheme cytochrome c family protein